MCENIYFRFFLLISTSVDIHTWTKSQSHPSTGDEELWEKITWLISTCSTQFKARQEPEVARESNNEPGGEDNTCGHTPSCPLLAPNSNLKWDMRHSEKQAAYDSIATVGEIRVYRRADFQSGSRVLKKVFWTFSYLYLWHTMWFHAKKLLKILKFWNR